MDIHVVALEGLHERFSHAIGLRASNRREAGNEAEPHCKVDRLVGSVGTTVVGEPLDRMWSNSGTKALLDGLQHQIADHLTADAADTGAPGHDLPIAGVQRKCDPDSLTVPTGNFEAVGSP